MAFKNKWGINVKSRAMHTNSIYLNISKVFDRMWQNGLLHKLYTQFGIQG